MSENHKDRKPTDNMEALKQEASACGHDCGCNTGVPSNRVRWIVGVIIILAAGVLVARAIIKNNSASVEKVASGFASLPIVGQMPAPLAGAVPATSAPRQAKGPSGRLPGDAAKMAMSVAPATVAVQEIGALSELNAVAADTGGVFVFLPGKNEPLIKAPLAQMRSAARTIEARDKRSASSR